MKRFVLGFFLLNLLDVPAVRASDNQDEVQFHYLYKKYAAEPTSEETWQSLMGQMQQKNYSIQKGDTLWEISKLFFGDPSFWPKIWSLNRDIIFNPHDIRPQDQVLFDLGSAERPPSVRVIREGAEGSGAKGSLSENNNQTDEGSTSESGEGAAQAAADSEKSKETELKDVGSVTTKDSEPEVVELKSPIEEFMLKTSPRPQFKELPWEELPPLPKAKFERPVRDLPNSLPHWQGKLNTEERIIFDITSPLRPENKNQNTLTCFAVDSEKEKLGRVQEIENGMHAAHEQQFVHLNLERAQIGQRFMIIKKYESIKKGGWLYEVEGEVQVLENIADNSLYRGIITKAHSIISIDAELVPIEDTVYEERPITQLNSNIRGVVITGSCYNRRTLFGPGEVVFIRAEGQVPGVGTQVTLYRSEWVRQNSKAKYKNPRLIGAAQVIKTSGDLVTAVVVAAREEILAGDRTDSLGL